jgi:hypothetical protein
VSTPDAAAILDDVVSLIGADVRRIRELVGTTERVLTGEEARILAGYARALGDVARARKAADDDGLTPEEQAALDEFEKSPEAQEILRKAGRKET